MTTNERPQIIALPNGGTGVWLGNANGNFPDDILDALFVAGVDMEPPAFDAAMAEHRRGREDDALQAEAGIVNLSGGSIVLKYNTVAALSGRTLAITLIVTNVRGRECLFHVLRIGDALVTVATQGEVDHLTKLICG